MVMETGIGKRIREVRTAKGISVTSMSKLLGVSTTAIWNWESKDRSPRPEILSKVADALGVPERYLAAGDIQKDSPPLAKSPPSPRSDPNDSSGADSVARLVEETKAKISAMTGFDASRIKLRLEFWSD
jgi:transcriptional regulator with XRE-family HTH domain